LENKPEQTMVKVEKTGGAMRGVAITALLLTIGVILRLVSPSMLGITPNWIIAMYCLALMITNADYKQALGTGLVAGVVNVVTSKALLPHANLVSEPIGALVCVLIASLPFVRSLKIFGLPLMPAISTLLSTLASGMVFITITKVVMSVPMNVYLYAMIPVVLSVAAVNCVVAQVLFFPANKLFFNNKGSR
jgi:energy-coupling factor transport system ATP-binding protein